MLYTNKRIRSASQSASDVCKRCPRPLEFLTMEYSLHYVTNIYILKIICYFLPGNKSNGWKQYCYLALPRLQSSQWYSFSESHKTYFLIPAVTSFMVLASPLRPVWQKKTLAFLYRHLCTGSSQNTKDIGLYLHVRRFRLWKFCTLIKMCIIKYLMIRSIEFPISLFQIEAT